MALKQHITDFIELLALYKVNQAVICPGSRNAPITIALNRNPNFECFSVSDERSAGFIAMGMAQASNKPVIVVCTSGSAAYNFAPAVAEAFFQEIPLIIITADRPKEWIHQNEGQTVFQTDIYGKNVKKSFEITENPDFDTLSWYVKRVAFETIFNTTQNPKGPIHINIPISEPFYPTENEEVKPSIGLNTVEYWPKIIFNPLHDLVLEIIKHKKIGLLIGQNAFSEEIAVSIDSILTNSNIVLIGDISSNINQKQIQNHDYFLDINNDQFQLDMLISLGKSHISKPLKNYFKKYKPKKHYHIQEGGHLIDPLMSITTIIELETTLFFSYLSEILFEENTEIINQIWQDKDKLTNSAIEKYWKNYNQQLTDLQSYRAISLFFKKVESNWHLGNSMAVRYANLLFKKEQTITNSHIYCNRGTSGIDGSLSTAIGISLVQKNKLHTILLGDVSFFYDRNALWNEYLNKNLRIIVFNNAGGGIFRLIDGPNKLQELNTFFETKQTQSVEQSVVPFGFEYCKVFNINELERALLHFWNNDNTNKCIEIYTDPVLNQDVFKDYMKKIREEVQD